jgi:chemotaxis protein MotB
MAKRRRDNKGGGGDDADRWLGTYGDMVTLLMAFFVMLYAISQVDDAKFIALVRGLDVFGNTSNLDGMLDSGPALLDEGAAQDGTDTGNMIGELSLEPKADPEQEPAQAAAEKETPKEEEATEDQVDEVSRHLDAALDRAGLPRTVTDVRGDPRGVVISVSSDDLHFALGSTEISQLGRRIIGAIASVVRRYDEDVVVEGHTDNLPLRRPGYSNWNLSTDRAVAVVDRLQRVHDINPQRISATGYGEYQPLESNTSASKRARNRRVDVLLRLNEE